MRITPTNLIMITKSPFNPTNFTLILILNLSGNKKTHFVVSQVNNGTKCKIKS